MPGYGFLPSPDDERFSFERSLLNFAKGFSESGLSLPRVEFPLDEEGLFGLSPAFEALLDDLPDWSVRPATGFLNTIVFYLALSQREGTKILFFTKKFSLFFKLKNFRKRQLQIFFELITKLVFGTQNVIT